jgi:hypothetical protein
MNHELSSNKNSFDYNKLWQIKLKI